MSQTVARTFKKPKIQQASTNERGEILTLTSVFQKTFSEISTKYDNESFRKIPSFLGVVGFDLWSVFSY